jgi:hypothetical protein
VFPFLTCPATPYHFSAFKNLLNKPPNSALPRHAWDTWQRVLGLRTAP